MYTKEGKFVYSFHLNLPKGYKNITGMTVARNGRIAIAYNPDIDEEEVLVL